MLKVFFAVIKERTSQFAGERAGIPVTANGVHELFSVIERFDQIYDATE